MSDDRIHAAVIQVAAATPSIGAIVLAWIEAPLTVWQVRLGCAFIVLQIAYLAWKWWREAKRRR